MLSAILKLLVKLAFYFLEGVLIAYFASNAMWFAMAATILIVPFWQRDISYAYTNFLYEVLKRLKGEDEMKKFMAELEEKINNRDNNTNE